jgi:hypothetical protein
LPCECAPLLLGWFVIFGVFHNGILLIRYVMRTRPLLFAYPQCGSFAVPCVLAKC